MTATEIPTLQLLNWKLRTVDDKDRLCLNLADGTHTTVDDDLADAVREAPLYSTLRVQSGTISDGCIFNIEEMEIVQTDLVQPVLHCETLSVLAKNFFQGIFAEQGMLTHPNFQHTPIRIMTRSRLAPEPPLATRRLAAGGIKCDFCKKVFKAPWTLCMHKCKTIK